MGKWQTNLCLTLVLMLGWDGMGWDLFTWDENECV